MLAASDRTHQLLSVKQSDPHLVALSHALPSKSTKARHSGCRSREKATSATREEAFERCLHTLLFTFWRSRVTSTSTKAERRTRAAWRSSKNARENLQENLQNRETISKHKLTKTNIDDLRQSTRNNAPRPEFQNRRRFLRDGFLRSLSLIYRRNDYAHFSWKVYRTIFLSSEVSTRKNRKKCVSGNDRGSFIAPYDNFG